MSLDPVQLTSKLIACPSITPREAGTLTLLTEWLEPMGFDCHHYVHGETPDGPVENLIAVRKADAPGPHFAFAGHVDVVPPGEGWASDPFHPVVTDGEIIGRGATDMKGAIGAFVAALDGFAQDKGSVSLLITGDEEGPATYGTRAIMDEIEGFKQYLSVAEKDRLNAFNMPRKTPELFEKYLPYALALGVENDWSEQFAETLDQEPHSRALEHVLDSERKAKVLPDTGGEAHNEQRVSPEVEEVIPAPYGGNVQYVLPDGG